jgi:Ets-domain
VFRLPHSPASSLGDAADATSPYSVTSPYAPSLADPTGNGKRGRPRKHAPKVPLPPIYVFIRNLLYNRYYNPRVVSWVNESFGIFRINNTNDFARTWCRCYKTFFSLSFVADDVAE